MSFTFWLSVAVALLIVEIIALSFFFVFFSAAGFAVAGLAYAGLVDDFSAQIIVFGIIAIGSLLLMRKKLQESLGAPGLLPNDASKIITLSQDIPPYGEAQIEYQGSVWIAKNEGTQPMAKGDRVVVIRTDGVKLILGKAE